ncbi:MAG: nitrilase-related carbon-nitrogen hydrolase [Polyangiaceae bacterium]
MSSATPRDPSDPFASQQHASSSGREGLVFLFFTLASLSSGLLLYAADEPLNAWPVLFVALLPWLAVSCAGTSRSRAIWYASVTGLTYAVGLASTAKLPLLLSAPLVLFYGGAWSLVGLARHAATAAPPLVRALSTTGVVVALEWIKYELLNPWGTAPCFCAPARALSVVRSGACVHRASGLVPLLSRSRKRCRSSSSRSLGSPSRHEPVRGLVTALLASVAAMFAPSLVASVQASNDASTKTLRVAAVGWGEQDANERFDDDNFRELIEPRVTEATQRLACVVVFPETSLLIRNATALIEQLTEIARAHEVVLVVGYFDTRKGTNNAAIVGPQGPLSSTYQKTHLIFGMESYTGGDGSIVQAHVDGVRVGVLICQDDNFTDLSRAHGRAGTQLMLIPSNDWRPIRHLHESNSAFRPVENGYSMVRAVSTGVSASVSYRGERIGAIDHIRDEMALLVVDVPIPERAGTLFSQIGNWVVLPALGFIGLLIRWRNAGSRCMSRAVSTPLTSGDKPDGKA